MTIRKKAAWLVFAACGLFLSQAHASNVTVSSSLDRSSNLIEIVLAINPSPSTLSNFKFSLDYSADQASFTKAIFPSADVNSSANSSVGGIGQVNGSAVVDFKKGSTAVKLYFSTQESGVLTGNFQSVMLDGKEIGPVKLPAVSFNPSAVTKPSSDPVAASDIIVNGMNHSLGVHWSHLGDTVTGFRAEAWMLQSTGQLSGPIASCDAKATERTCVISGLQNGRIYRVLVAAIYPSGTLLMSNVSDPAIPFTTNLNGRCPLRALVPPPKKVLGSRQMCLKGKVSAYTHDGVSSRWICVGLGHGGSQTCGSP